MAKINSLEDQKNRLQEVNKGKTQNPLEVPFWPCYIDTRKEDKEEERWNVQSDSLCRRFEAVRKERTSTLFTVWRASACHERESHGKGS